MAANQQKNKFRRNQNPKRDRCLVYLKCNAKQNETIYCTMCTYYDYAMALMISLSLPPSRTLSNSIEEKNKMHTFFPTLDLLQIYLFLFCLSLYISHFIVCIVWLPQSVSVPVCVFAAVYLLRRRL